MKRLRFIFIIFLVASNLKAQDFTLAYLNLEVTNSFVYTKLSIETEQLMIDNGRYLVVLETKTFKNKKPVVKYDTIKVNKPDLFPIQNILLNLDNAAFKKEKSYLCLDGLNLTLKFSDIYLQNNISQGFECINSDLYQSAKTIFDFFPFKKNYFPFYK